MKAMTGPILADMAANLLVATLVVLIVVGRMLVQGAPPPEPSLLQAGPTLPIDGATAVEGLRQRLLPGAPGIADLGPERGPLPDTVAFLLILDPRHYPETRAELAGRRQGWMELTVPAALKTHDNQWHPDFLALAQVADNPSRFRIALEDLLVRRQGGNATPDAFGSQGEGRTLRFPAWFLAAANLFGLTVLFASLWAMTRLRRWALKA